MKALVSIVMPTLNQGRFLNKALESIATQDYPQLEVIVQDGGSSDCTHEILRHWRSKDDRIKWQTSPDTGPADAVNMAIKASHGIIIGWLNSDDIYAPEAVSIAVDALSDYKTVLVYGNGEFIDENGNHLGRYPTRPPSTGLDGFRSGCYICQPTVFFKRVLTDTVGFLNCKYKVSFDMEYWLRIFTLFPDRVAFVDRVQAFSRIHDNTITSKRKRQVAIDGADLTKKYCGSSDLHWAVTFLEYILSHPNHVDVNREIQHFIEDISCYYDEDTISDLIEQLKVAFKSRTSFLSCT